MPFPLARNAIINQDTPTPTTYLKVAPYISSNNLILVNNTYQKVSYTTPIFDFVIVPNNGGGFPGGNGATAANVMY